MVRIIGRRARPDFAPMVFQWTRLATHAYHLLEQARQHARVSHRADGRVGFHPDHHSALDMQSDRRTVQEHDNAHTMLSMPTFPPLVCVDNLDAIVL